MVLLHLLYAAGFLTYMFLMAQKRYITLLAAAAPTNSAATVFHNLLPHA